ncbi:MAG TPA: hypothetical protein V6D17_00645 [Candidatus Obscuribacterales bacterium]
MEPPQEQAQGKLFGVIALIALGALIGIIACVAVLCFVPHEGAKSAASSGVVEAASGPAQAAGTAAYPAQEIPISNAGQAMAAETDMAALQTAQPQAIVQPPQSGETVSGYPIYTGDKAIDYPIPMPPNPHCTIGRNGLQSNPCVDPPSCKGRAYRTAY